MARLQQIYREKIVPDLKQSLGLKNTMQVPRILKITVNMGVARPWPIRRSWTLPPRTSRRYRTEAGRDQGEEVGRDFSRVRDGQRSAAK